MGRPGIAVLGDQAAGSRRRALRGRGVPAPVLLTELDGRRRAGGRCGPSAGWPGPPVCATSAIEPAGLRPGSYKSRDHRGALTARMSAERPDPGEVRLCLGRTVGAPRGARIVRPHETAILAPGGRTSVRGVVGPVSDG